VLFATSACVVQEPFQPTANTLVVHAVLDPTTRDQIVVVQATTGRLPDQRVVSGAAVSITTPDGRTLVADELRDSSRYLVSNSVPAVTTIYRVSLDRYRVALIAGGTYKLRIEVPDGRIVTGTTTIPSATPISSGPTISFDRSRDTLRFSWPRVAGAPAYEVFVQSPGTTAPFGTLDGIFADTAIALNATTKAANGRPLFIRTSANILVVNAVDANYYDYFRRSSDPFTAVGLINRLDGAVGLFGSIVPVLHRTVIVQ
jgi:hypothetical protein